MVFSFFFIFCSINFIKLKFSFYFFNRLDNNAFVHSTDLDSRLVPLSPVLQGLWMAARNKGLPSREMPFSLYLAILYVAFISLTNKYFFLPSYIWLL